MKSTHNNTAVITSIRSFEDLCAFLSEKPSLIRSILNNPNKWYTFELKEKKGGGSRLISKPKYKLKMIQKKIYRKLLRHFPISEIATGWRKGSSQVLNATCHLSNRFVCTVDIKDCFNSIHSSKVESMLRELGFHDQAAKLITKLLTVNYSVPQGPPPSPYLVNLMLSNLDKRLKNLSKIYSIEITRHCDDIAISGGNVALKLQDKIIQILRQEGFIGHKIKIMPYHKRQEITGIIVNKRPNVSKKYRRSLRSKKHLLQTKGPSAFPNENSDILKKRLAGQSEWIRFVKSH